MTPLLLVLVAPPQIIPLPASMEVGQGAFQINASTRVAGSREAIGMVRKALSPATGFKFAEGRSGETNTIDLSMDPSGDLGPEAYRLVATPERVTIEASAPAGLFYGVQTLRQLLPADIYSPKWVSTKWEVPAVTIVDAPRYQWRGFMLDVARHFMPKDDVKKMIDTMAIHKLNTLHFHLTDDQGWRIEIKKYPKLTKVGGWRKQTMEGHYRDQKWDGKRHGGFYTQGEIKELVKYAQERFITIVPEIEMPGHATAAIASYPELGNTGKQIEVGTSWGVIEDIFNPEESTITFLQNVLDEVTELFPSKFIHVGGDEAPKKQWDESPAAQAKIKALGLKDSHELQSWFIKQMDAYLDSKGRRLIGWDEILEGGLAPGATVMSWRGEEGGITAAKSGHDVVMTPTTYLYFDYYQASPDKEPLAIGGNVTLEKVYGYNPDSDKLTVDERKHILGVQANLWTEYIADVRKAQYMAYPRLCALSEIAWTPQASRDYGDFLNRLPTHLRRLDAMGTAYRPLDRR